MEYNILKNCEEEIIKNAKSIYEEIMNSSYSELLMKCIHNLYFPYNLFDRNLTLEQFTHLYFSYILANENHPKLKEQYRLLTVGQTMFNLQQ
jgi:hypothetical protein